MNKSLTLPSPPITKPLTKVQKKESDIPKDILAMFGDYEEEEPEPDNEPDI